MTILLTLLVALGAPPEAPAVGDTPTLAEVTRKLVERNMVDGAACGFADSVGGFYAGSLVFLAKGTRAGFEKLLANESPTIRIMGLFCLARTRGEKAVPVLRRHLGDGGRVEFQPYG